MRFCLFFLVLLLCFTQSSFAESSAVAAFSSETAESRVARVFSSLFPAFGAPMLNDERLCADQERRSASPLVHISITPKEEIVAYSLAHTTPGEIVLSQGLLREVSDAELRFVLAHEMGHIMAGHVAIDLSAVVLSKRQLAKVKSIRERWEFEADRFAYQQVQRQPDSGSHSGHSVLAYLSVQKAKQNLEAHTANTPMEFENRSASIAALTQTGQGSSTYQEVHLDSLQSALTGPKQIDLRIAVLDSLHSAHAIGSELGL